MANIIDISERLKAATDLNNLEQFLRDRGADDELIAFALELHRVLAAELISLDDCRYNVTLPPTTSPGDWQDIEQQIRVGWLQSMEPIRSAITSLVGKLLLSEMKAFQYKRFLDERR